MPNATISGQLTNSALADPNNPFADGRVLVSDPDTGEDSFQPQDFAETNYGYFGLEADGSYSFAANTTNSTVVALGAGATIDENVNIYSFDGTAGTIKFTITGINDVAEIGGALENVAREDQDTPTEGVLTVNDPDAGESVFQAQNDVTTSYGTFSIDASGKYTYILDSSRAEVQGLGDDEFLFERIAVKSFDGTTRDVFININGYSDAATFTGNSATINEDDVSVSGTVVVADVDTPDPSVEAQSDVATAYGSFSIGENGAFTYVLNNDNQAVQALSVGEFLEDVIFIRADSISAGSVTITINGTNDAPVANIDYLNAVEDTPVTYSAADLLANDTDLDGDNITISSVSSGFGGTAVLNDDGSVTFTPNADYYNVAEFTYTITDGAGGSDSAVASISISSVDDPIVFGGDISNSAIEGQEEAVVGRLTVTDVDILDVPSVREQIGTEAAYGAFSIDSSGSYTYTLDNSNTNVQALGEGETVVDTIVVEASDGTTQNVSITITGVNDAPIAVNDTLTATQNTITYTASQLLGNDEDIEGDTLEIASVTAISGGFVILNPDGTVSFTASSNFSGAASFSYIATDGTDTSNSATVTVNVVPDVIPNPQPQPQPPVTEGTAGNDNIAVGTSTTPTYGGAGSDNIQATPAAGTTAQLFGGSATNDPNDGGDTISVSGAGSVVAYGNGGNDQITVTATGSASVFGGMGDDRVSVTNNADNSVVGGMGADTIAITGNGNNQVLGGSSANDPNDGADEITISGNGNNTVYANGGNDTIVITGSGSNTVYGGAGNDAITGGSGNDQIVGGQGSNVLTGGAGSDKFVFTSGGQDIITDFNFAEGDRIALNGEPYGFTQTSDGNAAILIGESGVIVLAGVSPESLSADFFA